ncbi:MAG: glucose-1-phosphate adenylyltransferase [Verrucomicrobiota bacterium]
MKPGISIDVNDVIAVILGGGEGTRLFPLTKERSKPAVPLGCKYRFVDIPLSMSINSGIKRIFLLTQYLSSSLHRHIQQSYSFDHYAPQGFIEILAAQKNRSGHDWYLGTADAVRQNVIHFDNHRYEHVLILSGDQLYRMDYRDILNFHAQSGADITVATIPVIREPAKSFGIMHIDEKQRIIHFVEKPKEDSLLDTLRLPATTLAQLGKHEEDDLFLASMGIYVFNQEVLKKALENEDIQDFGKHIIPSLISSHKVCAYIHEGYWEDIGTIRAYYEANLNLTDPIPKFNFYDTSSPIYTHARYLPASKVNRAHISRAVFSDGCIVTNADIIHSLVGLRTRIESGVIIKDSIILGSDFFETLRDREENLRLGRPHLGIGENSFVEGCIVDKNPRIGKNVIIRSEGKTQDEDHPLYHVRDGIVIIPKNTTIPDGTVI